MNGTRYVIACCLYPCKSAATILAVQGIQGDV
jgi:hypothetical protein